MWISHFLLWSFGDMLALLQETTEPITETVIMVIAPSLAIIQTFMVVYSMRGSQKYVRYANIVVPFVYLLFNVQYLFESIRIWSYVLGAGYIGYNLMIIWTAWKWRAD
jgi:branched-subunit amino acid transport protein AzlD